MKKILTREEFKLQVLTRDNNSCVICKLPAVDAHHILDRSLFDDEGYYTDNGVSLCSEHHLQAEQTIISCKELRAKANITEIVLPEHLYTEEEWDHWGNIILPSGARLKGELFFNDNVQKALRDGGVINSFLEYIKYQRTYHLPSSPNLQNDDRQHKNVHELFQEPIIASLKMDGECSTLYSDYNHARSIDSKHHESRSWLKALHGRIAHEIPKGWRICGENVFAKHSIHYLHLKDFFYVFSIWNEKNEALSWEDTLAYCDILGLHTVPVFHSGISCEKIVQQEFDKYCLKCPDPVEGYVIRRSGKIPYQVFKTSTAKYVRKGHVETDKFWMSQPVIPNELEAGPIYTNFEIKQLLELITDIDVYQYRGDIDLFNFYNTIGDIYNDTIMLKYCISNEIDAVHKYLNKLGNWSDVLAEIKSETLSKIYDVLFGDLEDVPLYISDKLKRLANWRLEHGK
jgi:hypothetical protein